MDANENPVKTLDALVKPSPLTVGQVALLERIKSPLLRLDISSYEENQKAVYILSMPREEATRHIDTIDEDVKKWADETPYAEFITRFKSLLGSICDFLEMLPKTEANEDPKA